jgi:hypothetical protein
MAFQQTFSARILAFSFGLAYWVWHWDIGYKFSNAMKPDTSASSFSNTMNREPPEPERAPGV